MKRNLTRQWINTTENGQQLNTGVTLHPRTKLPVKPRKPRQPKKSISTVLREIFVDPYPAPDTCYTGFIIRSIFLSRFT